MPGEGDGALSHAAQRLEAGAGGVQLGQVVERERVAAARQCCFALSNTADHYPFGQSSAFLDADGTLLMCGANPKYHARQLCRGQEIRQNIAAPIAGFTSVRVQSIAA